MQCISPIKLRRNGITVPCGRCNFCLQSLRSDWTFRLHQEFRHAESAWFITFTYSDENIPLVDHADDDGVLIGQVGTLRKEHMQKFMKRLRKDYQSDVAPIRYYTVGEYGSNTLRPHYHSIMFNLTPEGLTALADVWGYGHVMVLPVNDARLHYVTKYHLNKHIDNQTLPPNCERPFLLSLIGRVVSA